MKPLNLQFLPLTFIDSAEKIKEQIINTAVFASLLEEYDRTNLKFYLESTQYGYTASSSEQGDYKFLRITDINHGAVEWNNVPFCSGSGVEKYLLKSNDILVARTGGTTGKSHLVTNPPNNAVFASYLIRLRPEPHTDPLFIDAFLNSYLFWNQVVAMKSGSAQPNVNAEKLKELILPKCDLATQNRVVGFIKNPETMDADLKHRVLRVIEKYDTLNGLLSTTDWQLGLIPQLRQALLREAMQGQLLPQDPADEPAALLLKKLQAAKAATGKGGKGKAGALFAEEAEAVEGPFPIPENWDWITLGEIASKIGSGSTPKAGYSKEGVPFFRSQNIHEEGLELSDVVFISQDVHHSMRGTQVQANDVLLNITGGSLGRATLVTDLPSGGNVSQHVCIVRSATLDSRFLHKLVLSPYFQDLIFASTSGAGRQGLPKYNLEQFLIPIPPLAEQHRIVAKLEQLLQHCDALEQRIRESRRLAEQLLQTALREALSPPAGTEHAEETASELAEVGPASPAPRRGRPRQPKFLLDNPPPDLFNF